MVWLYVENWSLPIFLEQLKKKGLPHGKSIIKVFAADQDPRGTSAFNDPELYVAEVNGDPFIPEEPFTYGDRVWTGESLEQFLTERAQPELWPSARGLFRFSNCHGFTHEAMSLMENGQFLVPHPMEVIDGWHYRDERMLHLDVFIPSSVNILRHLIKVAETSKMGDYMLGTKWRRKVRFKY